MNKSDLLRVIFRESNANAIYTFPQGINKISDSYDLLSDYRNPFMRNELGTLEKFWKLGTFRERV